MLAEKLAKKEIVATIAVKDIGTARKFYEDKLGLKPSEPANDDVMIYKTGSTNLFVYKSDYAGGYGATVATWPVDGIEELVEDLKQKGITFEHYDNLPDTTRDGDIHVSGDGAMKAAWFKDPDGSILALVEG